MFVVFPSQDGVEEEQLEGARDSTINFSEKPLFHSTLPSLGDVTRLLNLVGSRGIHSKFYANTSTIKSIASCGSRSMVRMMGGEDRGEQS